MARIRKKVGEEAAVTRQQQETMKKDKKGILPNEPPAHASDSTTSPTSPRQARMNKKKVVESATAISNVAEMAAKANSMAGKVLDIGKKRKQPENVAKKKTIKKNRKLEVVSVTIPETTQSVQPPLGMVDADNQPLLTISSEVFGTDKENPAAPTLELLVPSNPIENTNLVHSTTTVPIVRQPLGQSISANSSDFKRNQEFFSELLRSPQLEVVDEDGDILKQPALVTQIAGSQETTVSDTVRNLNFELEDNADNLEIVLMDDEEEGIDIQKNIKEWELNNSNRPKERWCRLDQPMNKFYEENVPSPPLEKYCSDITSINHWMTSHHPSKFVRRFFPNLDRQLISHFRQILSY